MQLKNTIASIIRVHTHTLAEPLKFQKTWLVKIFGALSLPFLLDHIGGWAKIAMYELLIQYLTIGRREVEVSWLRERLCLTTEYPRMLDFKKRVIEVAVTQINQHSDIEVSYTQRKTGKAVTHLIFEIKEKRAESQPAAPRKVVRDKNGIDKAYIEKHARPGESYDQAYRRLLEERHGQQQLGV